MTLPHCDFWGYSVLMLILCSVVWTSIIHPRRLEGLPPTESKAGALFRIGCNQHCWLKTLVLSVKSRVNVKFKPVLIVSTVAVFIVVCPHTTRPNLNRLQLQKKHLKFPSYSQYNKWNSSEIIYRLLLMVIDLVFFFTGFGQNWILRRPIECMYWVRSKTLRNV